MQGSMADHRWSVIDELLRIPMDKALPGWNTLIPRVILGDVAFPLNGYLKKPYKKKTHKKQEKIFRDNQEGD